MECFPHSAIHLQGSSAQRYGWIKTIKCPPQLLSDLHKPGVSCDKSVDGLSHAGVPEFQDRKRWECARGWGVHKQGAKLWTLGKFVLAHLLVKRK